VDASWWLAVLAASALCFATKLAGLSLPAGVLRNPRVERAGMLLPVALLAALVATQSMTSEGGMVVDARLAALGVAAVAVWRGWPFLVVVGLAVGVAAGLRAVAG